MRRLLWMRIGDVDSYEPFHNVYDAAEWLLNMNAGAFSSWVNDTRGVGLETANYSHYDFISLYWGDKDADFSSELSSEEKEVVEQALAK